MACDVRRRMTMVCIQRDQSRASIVRRSAMTALPLLAPSILPKPLVDLGDVTSTDSRNLVEIQNDLSKSGAQQRVQLLLCQEITHSRHRAGAANAGMRRNATGM